MVRKTIKIKEETFEKLKKLKQEISSKEFIYLKTFDDVIKYLIETYQKNERRTF